MEAVAPQSYTSADMYWPGHRTADHVAKILEAGMFDISSQLGGHSLDIILARHLVAGFVLGSLAILLAIVRGRVRHAAFSATMDTLALFFAVLATTDLTAAGIVWLLAPEGGPLLGLSKILAALISSAVAVAVLRVLQSSRRKILELGAQILDSHRELTRTVAERERDRSEALARLDAAAINIRRLASVVEASPDPIIGINADGTVWQWGRAAESFFRLNEDEVLGRHAGAHSGSALDVLWREVVRLQSESRTTYQSELELQIAEHERRVVWLSLSQLPDHGKGVGGWAIALRDITEKRRVESAIAHSLQEKEALLKEVHHRVKNNLQLICSLIRLQSKEISDLPSLSMFRKSEERIRSLALVHEKLYRAESLSQIPFGDYVSDLAGQLVRAAAPQGTVRLERTIEDAMLPIDVAISAGLIVNELLSYSIHHALSSAENSRVVRVCLRRSGGRIVLTISDTGTNLGSPEVMTDPHSLAFKLVKSLSGQLRGELRWEHDDEARFVLSIPEQGVEELHHGGAVAA